MMLYWNIEVEFKRIVCLKNKALPRIILEKIIKINSDF